MNAQRRGEVAGLADEAREMLRQVELQLNGDTPKYSSSEAWQDAGDALVTKITHILDEEKKAVEEVAYDAPKQSEAHYAMEEATVYLEHALNCANAGANAAAAGDFEQAAREYRDCIKELKKSED